MVDSGTFLRDHQAGLGGLLGIAFDTARPDRIVARMTIGSAHAEPNGRVQGGVIMAMADCCGAYGTILNLPPGHVTSTIESKSNFLARGEGPDLTAESVPVQLGTTLCVWRTTLRRAGDTPIAEVTQTQLVTPVPSDEKIETGTEAAVNDRAERPVEVSAQSKGQTESSIVTDRRRQIFEGASRVLTEKGYAGATIREVAAAAGMPVPTMYQYIERKEDLLLFIYESFMADYTVDLRRAVNAASTTDTKLDAAIHETLANFDRNNAYIKLMFQETRALKPDAREKVYALDGRYISVWREILEGIVPATDEPGIDAELLANFIYFLCTVWPLRHWAIGGYGLAAAERALAQFIKHGLGPVASTAQTVAT